MHVKIEQELPPGTYQALLSNIKEINNQYGASALMIFVVTQEGRWHGTECTTIANINLSASSKMGKMVQAMLGRALQPGESIDLDEFKGKRGLISVSLNKNGKPTVDQFVPQQSAQPPQEQPAATPPQGEQSAV